METIADYYLAGYGNNDDGTIRNVLITIPSLENYRSEDVKAELTLSFDEVPNFIGKWNGKEYVSILGDHKILSYQLPVDVKDLEEVSSLYKRIFDLNLEIVKLKGRSI